MDLEHAAPIIDLDMAPTPLDTDDDDMEEPGVDTWQTVALNQKKRNKVVMKLKGTPSSTKRESFRSSFLDKTCIIEGDMSGRGKLHELCPGCRHKASMRCWLACLQKLLRNSWVLRLKLRRYRNFIRALRARVV